MPRVKKASRHQGTRFLNPEPRTLPLHLARVLAIKLGMSTESDVCHIETRHDLQDVGGRRPNWLTIVLAIALVLTVCAAGAPSIDGPWLQGDEFIFIVSNPEVTGAGIKNDSLWQRLELIFHFPPEQDLYQPLPILTYAIEWALCGNSPSCIRWTDVLLHALNALLLWWVLHLLLRRENQSVPEGVIVTLGWALALLWALHPVLTRAYAADMGRTHLLSATFALLSLGLHRRCLEPGRGHLFGGAAIALIAAMLCKVIPGWILLVVILEANVLGWRKMVRSVRVYLVAVLCVGFALLAYWTSLRAGLIEDASTGLFGDPLARSGLAVWIYFRNLAAPLWLSPWYLPDPRTVWSNPLVWLGLLLALGSVVHAIMGLRHQQNRNVTLGWVWCWALLLPVIGLVGARELAADDRYLYQPLMGIMFVLGTVALRWLSGLRSNTPRKIIIVAALIGGGFLLWDLPHIKVHRSTLRSRDRILSFNPGDPRALEALARGYDFATNHPLPLDDMVRIPAGESQYSHFLARCIATLRQAAAVPDLETYFPGPADRAPFHRRLSHALKMTRQYQNSLEQALIARELQPEHYLTWVRLAHAYHGLQQWEQAIQAYQHCEQLLPSDAKTRATHFTDFGYLLLFDLEQSEAAYPKFQAAVASGQARTLAMIGLARCEIRVGQGARGYELIMPVLNENPQNALAGLVLAEYHLRSHHWAEAYDVYSELIRAYPGVYRSSDWYYEALRGFQAVCGQLGRWHEAALAWDEAVRLYPPRREYRSFRVWALACSGAEDASAWANELLADDPDNPLACLAQMLSTLRAGEITEAVEWVRRAGSGRPIPKARELERAVAALTLLGQQEQLPVEKSIIVGVLYLTDNRRVLARDVLTRFLEQENNSPWRGLAASLLEEAGDS